MLYLLIKKIFEEIKNSSMIVKQSPLNGISIGNPETVAIRELQGLNSIDLRVAPGSSSQVAIAEALEITLPVKPGQTSRSTSGEGDTHVLCLAPDWWFVVGLNSTEQKLLSLQQTDQYHFSIVDVSGQRTTIELGGPNAREVLAHLWEQDLREKSFPVASVSQGLMAKAPVIVWRIASFRYRVMVRSSFALHLWTVLADAVEEYA
jgi:sarcosine oxidase, subunit gamma